MVHLRAWPLSSSSSPRYAAVATDWVSTARMKSEWEANVELSDHATTRGPPGGASCLADGRQSDQRIETSTFHVEPPMKNAAHTMVFEAELPQIVGRE